MGQLNELQIKAAQPRDKEYLLADGEGLYLRVRPTGKAWVYRYKEAGREAKLSLGRYPAMSLAAARKTARAEAEKRAGGVDPREARREEEERDRVARLNTFELTARAWHAQAQKDRQWSASYAEKVMRHLELHGFPWIGSLAMEAIKPTELVRCLHRIRDRGNLETAQRVREAVQHVFQYAVRCGRAGARQELRERPHRRPAAPARPPLSGHHRSRQARTTAAGYPELQRPCHHSCCPTACPDAIPAPRATAFCGLGRHRPRADAVALPSGEDEDARMDNVTA